MFYSKINQYEFSKAYKEFDEPAEVARRRTALNLLSLRRGLDGGMRDAETDHPESEDPEIEDRESRDEDDPGTPIPRKKTDTLLLATWNIREFDSTKYGYRLPESYYYIAEIISRFDLVAIQEVRSDLAPVRRLLDILGSWWDMLATDVTLGTRGNGERMVYIFDKRKVTLDGIAGEVVIPPRRVRLPGGGTVEAEPAEQLYRTPYVCSFSAHWRRLLIATVHILYGADIADNPKRVEEIDLVAQFMRDMHKSQADLRYETIILGDFNIYKPTDTTMEAITRAGFRVPPELKSIPGSNVARDKFYDQIAFLPREDSLETTGKAGVFDFFEYVFRYDADAPDDPDKSDFGAYKPAMGPALFTTTAGTPRQDPTRYYRDWRTHQMSDHLPMWIELKINFADAYLTELANRNAS